MHAAVAMSSRERRLLPVLLDWATEDSDVDLLVEFSEPVGWEFIDLYDYLEQILGMKVDLATPGALKPQLRDSILNEVVYI